MEGREYYTQRDQPMAGQAEAFTTAGVHPIEGAPDREQTNYELARISLDQVMADLYQTVSELEPRLRPVLRAPRPQQVDDDRKEIVATQESQLVANLDAVTHAIGNANRQIRSLLDRLDI